MTEVMQRHYSTVNATEMEQSIGKVISLANFKGVHEGQVKVEVDQEEQIQEVDVRKAEAR